MLIIANILTVLLVFVCLLLILVVMMQRPKQEGLGAAFGSAVTDRFLGSGTTDFLQKSTIFLSVFFFVCSLSIASLVAWDRHHQRDAQVDKLRGAEAAAAPAAIPTGNEPPPPPAAANAPAVNLDPAQAIPKAGEGGAKPADGAAAVPVLGEAKPADGAAPAEIPPTDANAKPAGAPAAENPATPEGTTPPK